jgi:prepilin peptidase CpaA
LDLELHVDKLVAPISLVYMHSIAWWPTLIALLIATASDLRSRRIPNWLVFPFLVAGVIVSTVSHGWRGLEQSILGVLLAAFLLGILYWLGGMGMGDLKLCAAIGAWIGPQQLVLALVMMGLAGGVMALFWAIRGGFLKESLSGAGDLVFGMRKRGLRPHPTLVLANPCARKMPYAPAIAIGTIFSFFSLS